MGGLKLEKRDLSSLHSITGEIPVPVIDRRIEFPYSNAVAVSGDYNSQYIHFTMNRFFDGVDLSEKVASIKYLNALGQGDRTSVLNLTKTDDMIDFDWLLGPTVALADGRAYFSIEFLNRENESAYCWQTVPCELIIEKGLAIEDSISTPPANWLNELISKMDSIDQKASATITEAQAIKESMGIDFKTENDPVFGVRVGMKYKNDKDFTYTDRLNSTFEIRNVFSVENDQPPVIQNIGTAQSPIYNIGLPKGLPGHTPVKGVDFWTEADKQELIDELLAILSNKQ